ncbi:uncharacterized protein [Euwallacea fornicatus]|uniref:uncharacterized protein n=1 Tax=Euwallacea fornicatus TaxID=995702 RepID=UPI00338D3D99
MNLSDSEPENVDLNWKRVARDMIKIGERDGLSDGRDRNFQPSFDKGYSVGFQSGFKLGQLKFQRECTDKLVKAETYEMLGNASKGLCIICTSEKDNENVADVKRKQIDLITSSIDSVKRELNRLSHEI